ncbi:glycoside hydrolase family 5 protein [Pantoea stewartii]|uniref:Cellulase n=1 Tax=Pantoea stewartii subsp. stewartii DC283 TaxID=660596 RepID=H3RKR4_PANSE|nr:glycoside hydrolase family 5 protein [Pantoea stewartii]ARF52259.1 endoglucanase [Pantoea stewartii subsp. stewartii DC283]EHT97909.1 cellulase [Pantoea stewartii subsp. stewartii DC283]
MFLFRRRLIQLVLSAFAFSPISGIAVAPIQVHGNKIFPGSRQVNLCGNSLFWSNTGWGAEKFYNAGSVTDLKNNWHASILRASMGVEYYGGYLSDRQGNIKRVEAVVDAAIKNDMYVIIDWHSSHAEDQKNDAIIFFQEMAHRYGKYPNVIYEIYNEPLNVSWVNTIKPYATAVISAIRKEDPDNLIIVGTPNWSQDVDVAARDPLGGKNIAYTFHFYAGTHGQPFRNKVMTALNKGLPVFVTEWGTVNADGSGPVNIQETSAWIRFLNNNKISYVNWAYNDRGEVASTFLPGTRTLSASGRAVIDIDRKCPGHL